MGRLRLAVIPVLLAVALSSLAQVPFGVTCDNAEIAQQRNAIPRDMKQAFKRAFGTRLALANPDERFHATDVRGSIFLKERRLNWVMTTERWIVISYEHGGRGHHGHCLVFDREHSELQLRTVDPTAMMAARTCAELDEVLHEKTTATGDGSTCSH